MITNPYVFKGQDPCVGSDPISQAYFAAVLDLVGDVDWQEGEVGAVGVFGALLLALWCIGNTRKSSIDPGSPIGDIFNEAFCYFSFLNNRLFSLVTHNSGSLSSKAIFSLGSQTVVDARLISTTSNIVHREVARGEAKVGSHGDLLDPKEAKLSAHHSSVHEVPIVVTDWSSSYKDVALVSLPVCSRARRIVLGAQAECTFNKQSWWDNTMADSVSSQLWGPEMASSFSTFGPPLDKEHSFDDWKNVKWVQVGSF